MVRVIPGVEVKVVKEIVPQQLFPAGVVGMIGTANDGPVGIPTAVTSIESSRKYLVRRSLALHSTETQKMHFSTVYFK